MDLLVVPIACDEGRMNATGTFAQTDRTRVRRLPQRASYDVETVHGILDAGLVCHVGFVEDGRPVVIPTAYARVGDTVVLHGSSKSRTLLAAAGGAEMCVTVTQLDGLVLARSAFHHSVNYRSAVIFGHAAEVTDPARKRELLRAFTSRLYPDRWSVAPAARRAGAEGHAGRRAARCAGPSPRVRTGRADRRRGGHEPPGLGRRRPAAAGRGCAGGRRGSPARRHPPRWRGRRSTDRERARSASASSRSPLAARRTCARRDPRRRRARCRARSACLCP